MGTERAEAIERARTVVELEKRKVQVLEAELRLLELDQEHDTITATITKVRGLIAELEQKLQTLG